MVPPGQLFVMGDNRDNSRDSRFWGFLAVDQVKGRALLVYWSLDRPQGRVPADELKEIVKDYWDMIWNFRARTRWERSFHLIR